MMLSIFPCACLPSTCLSCRSICYLLPLKRLSYFFLYGFECSLYSLNTSPLLDIWFCKLFFPVYRLIFSSLSSIYCCQKAKLAIYFAPIGLGLSEGGSYVLLTVSGGVVCLGAGWFHEWMIHSHASQLLLVVCGRLHRGWGLGTLVLFHMILSVGYLNFLTEWFLGSMSKCSKWRAVDDAVFLVLLFFCLFFFLMSWA